MAHAPNRWASKILNLPVFSDAFAQAVLKSPYADLAFVSAMEVRTAPEFVVKVFEWSSSLEPDCKEVLLENKLMLEQYWSLAGSIEKAFFASTVGVWFM